MKLFKFKSSSKHKESTTGRGFFRRIAHDAFVDWTLSIVVSLVLAAALSAVGVMSYLDMDAQIAAKTSASASKSAAAASVDTRTLDAVLKQFGDRATLRADLLRGYSGPGDPSL